MEIKVKASFKSVDFDLAIEILLNSWLNRGNGLRYKWTGGGYLSPRNLDQVRVDLSTPMGFVKGVNKGVKTFTSCAVGYK